MKFKEYKTYPIQNLWSQSQVYSLTTQLNFPKRAKPRETKMTESVQAENKHRNEKFKQFITVAPYVSGHQGEYVDLKSIPWIDYSLIQEGLHFYEKYFSAIVLSGALSIFLGVVVKPISAVFFRVGSLHDPDAAYFRILKTFAGVDKFYRVLLHPNEAKSHFNLIRKMHAVGGTKKMNLYGDNRSIPAILKDESQEPWKQELVVALQKDFKTLKRAKSLEQDEQKALDKYLVWDPPVFISQLDMVATAFSSFGAMWISPEMFGIKDRNQEMRGIIHVWAVISKLLGVKDEFNIFIRWDPELAEKIMQNMMLRSFQTIDETVITLQHAFVSGHCKRDAGITYKGLLYQSLRMQRDFEGENLWSLMGWKDKFSAGLVQSMFWLLANVPGVMTAMNFILKLCVRRALAQHLTKSGLKRKLG